MAQIRYLIKRLSVPAMLPYAKLSGEDVYSFDLSAAQTKGVVMGNGETLQEENAVFFQAMCTLHGDNYVSPTEDTVIDDLSDVILYLDFVGIFDRDENDPKVALMQKKTEAMFRPDGITLDFGHGKNRYIAFERSANMSRKAKLSFVREDIYDRLKERITVGMKLGVCQLSKLYAYNGLMFSSGKRIETDMLWDKDAIVVIENPTAVYKDIDVITVEDTTKSGDVRKYERVEKKQDIPVELFDGEGLISPGFSEEIDRIYCGKHIHNSYQIRLPYIKGMVHEVNFPFLFENAGVDTITDMWGAEHPVKNIRMILTKSQFKGYGWMEENGLSFSGYLDRLQKYRHTLYITGVNNIDGIRETDINYQFISTLALSGEQFRPKDMPFDWMKDGSKKEWLTKTTEENYYKLLNDEWYQFDYYVDHTPHLIKSRRYRLAEMLRRNDRLLAEKVYRSELEKAAETLLQGFAKGNLFVHGEVSYLSSDLALLLAEILKPHIKTNEKTSEIYAELLSSVCEYTTAYGTGGEKPVALLRNPHIAQNEEAVVYPPKVKYDIRGKLLAHLNGVVMVSPQSLIAQRLGGADYDGDMVKVIYEPVICESIASHYKETDALTADRFANEYNLPLLNIPTAKPQMRDANDWYAHFECVKSTFSSRVGQISNAALDRSMIAYDENTDDGAKELNRRDTETLAILTGLEIDSVKSGIKPDLSEYLENKGKRRSQYLRYKRLLDDMEDCPAWYEDSFAKRMNRYIQFTDWNNVTANVEMLPYYAYMLKKSVPKKPVTPAPSEELFTFAKHPNWKDYLDKDLFPKIEQVIAAYDRCLKRIRSSKHPTPGNGKEKDVRQILMMRDQENTYTVEELYALFTDIDATRISVIYNAVKFEKWHFMKPEERLAFLLEYLPEEGFREYDGLFADFRQGGYRVFGDIICDIYAENKKSSKEILRFKNDTPELTAMLDAYLACKPGKDYIEAVATSCRAILSKIAPCFQIIRYAEAMGRRDFIFDVLLDEAEFYLIGGGNE